MIKRLIDTGNETNNPTCARSRVEATAVMEQPRDLAKLMGILANGGSYNGKSYMSPETIRLLTEVLTEGAEYVMGMPDLQFGRGVSPFPSPLVSPIPGFFR